MIAGRPALSILNLGDFAAQYGSVLFAAMIDYARLRLTETLGIAPFLIGVIGQIDSRNIALSRALPFDAITGYGLLPDWLGETEQDYAALIDKRASEWEEIQSRIDKPFLPVACCGWDATSRGPKTPSGPRSRRYPESPVVTGVTPRLFGDFVDRAIAFNERWHPENNVVFLHAWNEWTEWSVLEDSDRFGKEFLEEVASRARNTTLIPATAEAPKTRRSHRSVSNNASY